MRMVNLGYNDKLLTANPAGLDWSNSGVRGSVLIIYAWVAERVFWAIRSPIEIGIHGSLTAVIIHGSLTAVINSYAGATNKS